LNKAIRSMVEGTFEGAEKKREKEVAARAAGIGVAPSFTVPLFETRADGQTVTQDAGALVGTL
jgi:hypothetical protein